MKTEERNSRSEDIDILSVEEIVDIMNDEDMLAGSAISGAKRPSVEP